MGGCARAPVSVLGVGMGVCARVSVCLCVNVCVGYLLVSLFCILLKCNARDILTPNFVHLTIVDKMNVVNGGRVYLIGKKF